MNPDDKSLFLDAMEDVQPLKRCTDIHWQQSRITAAAEHAMSRCVSQRMRSEITGNATPSAAANHEGGRYARLSLRRFPSSRQLYSRLPLTGAAVRAFSRF